MPKKRAYKKNSEDDSSGKNEVKTVLEERIIENLVELQKIHTNLAEKFDKLASEISNLMALFEVAARSFAESPSVMATEKDKQFLDKIDKLIEQNKTIAKGLILMEDRVRERIYSPPKAPEEAIDKKDEEMQPSINSRPLPRF